MKQYFSAALLSALLLGAASAQTSAVSDSSLNSAEMQSAESAPAPVQLPESAQAVRRALESRGLLGAPAPAALPALRGLTIPDSLRALLPHAVWDQAAPSSSTQAAPQAGMSTGADETAAAPQAMGDTANTEAPSAGVESPDMAQTTEAATAPEARPALPSTGTNMVDPSVTGDTMTRPAAPGAPLSGTPEARPARPSTGTNVVDPVVTGDTMTQPTASGTEAGEQAQSGSDILSALQADGRFGTFLSLVKSAGLDQTLLDDQYTLLVPTDEAFAALDPALLAAIKADPKVAGYVLGYHVVSGLQTPGQGTLTNVYGDALPAGLQVSGEPVTAGNSQAYALDTVIVPADLKAAGGQQAPANQ